MNVWQAAATLIREGASGALATVARVRGSTPVPAGTKMLVGADGRLIGSIGGGCVEADVIGAALQAQASGAPALLTHHLNADLAGDLGLSCGGTVDIFVEPLLSDESYVRVLETAARAESGLVRTATQWTNFFTNVGNPTWLPPLTQPVAPGSVPTSTTQKAGYIATRIRAFIRAVQLFFSVSSVPTQAKLPEPDAPPTFDLPSFDPIALAVAELVTLHAGFTFNTPISPSDMATTVATVFPTDLAAQA